MNKNILLPLIIILVTCINACLPPPQVVTTEIVTVKITATPRPTSNFTPEPTNTLEPSATPTETPIPTLEGLSIPVPDPRITNPELFDLTNPKASIPQFVNALKMAGFDIKGEQVSNEIRYQEIRGKDSDSFVLALYDLNPDESQVGETLEGPIPLLIAEQNDNNTWDWQKATPKQLDKVLSFETGACGIGYWLIWEPDYEKALAENFSLVMSEEFHMLYTNAVRGIHDYSAEVDPTIEFAEKNNMRVQAHHIIWKRLLPDWLLEGNFSKDEINTIMQERVKELMTHFKGSVHEWTVVNEAVMVDRDYNGWLKNIWFNNLGPSYVEESFKLAREIDPDAILIYNDDIQDPYTNQIHPIQVKQVYDLVKNLSEIKSEEGVPIIDAVGFQMHTDAANPPDFSELQKIIRQFGELGVEVYITEADVYLGNLTGTEEENLLLQAEIYRDMLKACLESGVCPSFTMFGHSDFRSMYNLTNKSDPEAKPHILDTRYNAKPAYYAILQALLDAALPGQ